MESTGEVPGELLAVAPAAPSTASAAASDTAPARRPGIVRRMYNWVLHWAETPYGTPALFGISFIFFFICLIFSLSVRVPKTLKAVAIGTPFVFLIVDIFSWWATKWVPAFAYLEIAAGIANNVAAAFMILTSLHQMWILPRRGLDFPENAWER